MPAGAAGVLPGPAAPRKPRHRTREGLLGVGDRERGHGDRVAGPA